ncbi:MAG TPA: CBS domain-containing protein [Acidobacteriota bacterium]|jgi:CBS domain-containing protein
MEHTERIKDILKRKGHNVWSVSPETSIFNALGVMAEKNCGALLVMSGDHLAGIFSERDYARKVILKGKHSNETPVSEVMTAQVITVGPNNTVAECMKTMTAGRLRHLPVLENDRVIGMVSIGDLVNSIISVQRESIHHLEDYIIGKYPG